MNPRALIADDEPYLARYLAEELKKVWPELEIVATVGNGVDAAKSIESLAPDIAFLDIQMPGLTGIEVAQGIEGNTVCVFVTAYDEFALKAFDEGAIDYLVKPVNASRLSKTVERLKKQLQTDSQQSASNLAAALQQILKQAPQPLGNNASYLRYVRAHERTAKGEQVLQIDVNDVLYFDAADKYTCVVLPTGEKLLRTSISELEAQLDPSLFQRIHRSTLVNLKYVQATRRDESGRMFLIVKDHKRELPVSRAYHEVFARM